jgi:flagellar hook-associated protein 3 FlgL
MRITPTSIGNQVLRELTQGLADLARRQDQLASGKRLLVPSDDPAGAAQAILTRGRQAAAEQWTRNIAEARDRLNATDNAVQAVASALTRAHEIAVQGANATNDALARQALAREVDQILEGVLALANTRGTRGEYLFGGQESTRPPYTATRDVNGQITAVTPNPRGIDGAVAAEVSDGLTVTTGVSGTTVFGAPADATYAFAPLIGLRDSLDAGGDGGTALDEISGAIDRLAEPIGQVGGRLNWLGVIEERLAAESVTLAASLSRIEDLDMPKAVQEFEHAKIAYEAALASGANLLQMSLLQFLR